MGCEYSTARHASKLSFHQIKGVTSWSRVWANESLVAVQRRRATEMRVAESKFLVAASGLV